ncbi:formate--tetrahydrofolate ligase [Paenibacillus sp. SGZ-1009]|uniref:formate--tetrahydrofolate ligase n=1 Tax=Paenibacillus campi TaxID=3106031 RepID=UPI003A4C75FD
MANLRRHVRNLQSFGVPVMVVINHFAGDTVQELELIEQECSRLNVPVEISRVWAEGSVGGAAMARCLLHVLETQLSTFTPLYADECSLTDKIERIVTSIYGGDGVVYAPAARRMLEQLEQQGFGVLPVCMAKTPYSFTDQPSRLGAPSGFSIQVSRVSLSAGAGFVVVETGNTMKMPGLPRVPAAERMVMDEHGMIDGLF